MICERLVLLQQHTIANLEVNFVLDLCYIFAVVLDCSISYSTVILVLLCAEVCSKVVRRVETV